VIVRNFSTERKEKQDMLTYFPFSHRENPNFASKKREKKERILFSLSLLRKASHNGELLTEEKFFILLPLRLSE
jgi:hypothetical protein